VGQHESRWVPLLDWVAEDQIGYLGVDSLAVDPKNAANVYMHVGISYFNGGKSAILRSTDYGATFSITDVTSQFKAHGNGMGRQNGERLVVDPGSSNVLYIGTRWNGLFKSTNSGASWSQVTSLNVTTTPNDNGISVVMADPSSVSGGVAQRLFVGVSRYGSVGANFYRSDNAGASFSAVSGSPSGLMPQRAKFDGAGNLYITYANGGGPHGNQSGTEPMDSGQIWKYTISNGA
jgi:xyloglucan-specific exo-beta-1,4-glucanase